jgi:DNA-binding LacI/PurR family transcriptional regulator
MCVERLVALGHTDIGLLGQAPLVYKRGSNFPPRFRSAFAQTGARLGAHTSFAPTDEDSASVVAAFDRISAALPEMSALVMHCNEPVQSMVLEILRQRGIRVPEDISIISACSTFDTDHLNPPLDVIPLPADKSCTRAIALTMEQLAGNVDPHVELIEPTYVELGSTSSVTR